VYIFEIDVNVAREGIAGLDLPGDEVFFLDLLDVFSTLCLATAFFTAAAEGEANCVSSLCRLVCSRPTGSRTAT